MKHRSHIVNVKVHKFTEPLIYPFRTALGQHNNLENVLLRIRLANGIEGFGEAGVATHITGETVATTLKNLRQVGKSLVGQDVRDYRRIALEVSRKLLKNRSALAAVGMAILDALTKSCRIPLWRFFGLAKTPRKIVTDITIVISSLKETETAAQKFYAQGFRAFKVKIGRDMDLDLKRVLAVYRLTRGSPIYLDANQGYSARQSIQFLRELKKRKVHLALIEQPVPKKDFEGLCEVTAAHLAPVCADESVSTLADCRRVIRHHAANAINIKLMKSGFLEGEAIAKLAKQKDLKLMIGAMMESNLAITAAAHFAAGLGCFDFIDLDPPFFIKKGLTKNRFLNRQGIYQLSQAKPGIGIKVDD